MLDRFFDSGNPVMRFLSRIVDLAVLNLMTLVCCVPLITIGPALTAMNNVLIHLVRKDETYVTKMFRKSFKTNLGQGIKLGLIFTVFAAAAGIDLAVLHRLDTRAATGLMIVITCLAAFAAVYAVYAFALLSRYENTVRGTLANAAKLFLSELPRSAGMLGVMAVSAFVLYLIKNAGAAPFLLFGLTVPGYLCALLYNPPFEKMEPEEE